MKTFATKSKSAVLATAFLAALGVAFCLNGVAAGSGSPTSGSISATYVKKEAAPVGDPQMGHVVMLTMSKGKNANTSGGDFLDGMELVNAEIADLDRGNGPHQGYVTFSNGADSAVAKWQGKVTTTLNPDKTPNSTFSGEWAYVSGSGKYAGLKGAGTYSGRITSEQTYEVNWKGSYSLGGTAAAN